MNLPQHLFDIQNVSYAFISPFIAMKNLGTAHGLFKPTSTLHPHCLPRIKILINTIRPKM